MKKLIAIACAITAVTATPAMANEGRAEVRGGLATIAGFEEAFAGVGAGYDFDLGDSAFVGLDVGADKVLVDGANVFFSVGGRAGVKIADKTKIYVLGGGAFADGDSEAYAGVGLQQKFGQSLYGKLEYRRTLATGPDLNFYGAGIGVAF